jgi:hypothetical protein
MPSKNKRSKTKKTQKIATMRKANRYSHFIFYPFIFFVMILWMLYRSLFNFEVWFDEIIGKALFFGIPVWLYMLVSNFDKIANSFAFNKMRRGLMMGIAIGGIFGFITSIFGLWKNGGVVQPAQLFMADKFWWEFFLSLVTSFWETLFFFAFIHTVIKSKYRNWSLLNRLVLVAVIFLVFHLPNIILRFNAADILPMAILLFLFPLGQALLFESEENAYSLVLTQSIWGMVLLVHFG